MCSFTIHPWPMAASTTLREGQQVEYTVDEGQSGGGKGTASDVGPAQRGAEHHLTFRVACRGLQRLLGCRRADHRFDLRDAIGRKSALSACRRMSCSFGAT